LWGKLRLLVMLWGKLGLWGKLRLLLELRLLGIKPIESLRDLRNLLRSGLDRTGKADCSTWGLWHLSNCWLWCFLFNCYWLW